MSESRMDRDNDVSEKQGVRAQGKNPDIAGDGEFQSNPRNRENGAELREGLPHSDWEDSKMLVPSSLELGPGSVDRYVISKQIVRMQETRRLTPDDLDERRIVYPESSNRKLVNHFRNLRTKLLEQSGGNNFTLVVTGAQSGAGASFVALNLAAAFAFDEAKTALIIDCNLREPALHSTLDIIPEAGLTDFLGDSDFDMTGILYPTGIPRVRLIPAGSRRETASEFFTSFRMRQFIQAVRRRYPDRFIVLDTASIADSPDARILTELCDYVMLVVPHGAMTPTAVEQAGLALNSEKFLGAVING